MAPRIILSSPGTGGTLHFPFPIFQSQSQSLDNFLLKYTMFAKLFSVKAPRKHLIWSNWPSFDLLESRRIMFRNIFESYFGV